MSIFRVCLFGSSIINVFVQIHVVSPHYWKVPWDILAYCQFGSCAGISVENYCLLLLSLHFYFFST